MTRVQHEIGLFFEVRISAYIIIILALLLFIIVVLFIDRSFEKAQTRKLKSKVFQSEDLRIVNLKLLMLYLAKKNRTLEDVKHYIIQLHKDKQSKTYYNKALNQIKLNLNTNGDWTIFNQYFNAIYPNFYQTIIRFYPDISTYELQLMALLKLELSNNEIAQIFRISNEGIKKARYRLRKKMNLQTSDSLEKTVLTI